MQWLGVELNEVKRLMIQQDLDLAKQQNDVVLSEEEDPSFIAS